MKKVIKLWAPWCGPCRNYAPTFKEFADANPELEIIDLNMDEDKWQTARMFGVNAIPATIIVDTELKNFKVLMGAQTVSTLTTEVYGNEEANTDTEA